MTTPLERLIAAVRAHCGADECGGLAELRAALAALPATPPEQPVPAWQPIEIAPHGVPFLALMSDGTIRVESRYTGWLDDERGVVPERWMPFSCETPPGDAEAWFQKARMTSHMIDLRVRYDGKDYRFCADWLKAWQHPVPDAERERAIVGSPEHVAMWDAINAVVEASGGDAGNTSSRRQIAVVAVENALVALMRSAPAPQPVPAPSIGESLASAGTHYVNPRTMQPVSTKVPAPPASDWRTDLGVTGNIGTGTVLP